MAKVKDSAEPETLLTAADLAARLPRPVRRRGDWYDVRCPAHDDEHASLSFKDGNYGLVLLCRAGCSPEVVRHVLRVRGLLDASEGHRGAARVRRYEIRDPTGTLIAIHVREDRPDGKTFRWEQPDSTLGLNGRPVAELPLYGVEALASAPPDVPVVVAEGERARDALHASGVVSLDTVTGAAGTPGDEALRPLLGRWVVVLWPDADEPGRAHMRRIGAALKRLGHRDLRLLTWPEAREKDDAVDFFARGGTGEQLQDLIEAATPAEDLPEPPVTRLRAGPWGAARPAPEFLNDSEEGLDWFEKPMLAPGSITELFSPRGIGKTHVAHALGVKLARAGKRVLLLDRDNSRREVRRRLRAWGAAEAPTLKVMARDEVPPLTETEAWRGFPFRDYDLIIIDSLDATTEGVGEKDSAKPSRAIAPILDIARRSEGPAPPR